MRFFRSGPREMRHEQTAKEIWKEYHIKGIEYPEFSNPEELLKNWDYEEINSMDPREVS